MKKSVLGMILASAAFAGPVVATPEKQCDLNVPYKNRLSISPNSVSYERVTEDSWNYGFEYFQAPAFRGKNIDATVSVSSIKIGYSFAIDPRTRMVPSIGVSMFRDEGYGTIYSRSDMGMNILTTEITVRNPYFFHGTLGFGAEFDMMKSTTIGLSVHGLMGGVWGGTIDKMGDMSYGLNATLPITFRFGADTRWDVRMEPFAYLLKDYANYVGGKAALGYRF